MTQQEKILDKLGKIKAMAEMKKEKKKLVPPKNKLKGVQLPLPGITREEATEMTPTQLAQKKAEIRASERNADELNALLPRVTVSKNGQSAYFKQGDISFPVDVKDLNKVVGCNGESSPIDHLMDSEIVAMAQANKLPVQPYSRELLRPVLVGVLQTAWYRDIENHSSTHLDENQANRVLWYVAALKKYKEPVTDDAASNNGTGKATRVRHSAGKSVMLSKSFKIVKADAKSVASGREAALLGVLKSFKSSASFSQIVDAAKDSAFKTKQDFEQQVARFLKELIEHGAVEEVK